MTRMEAVLRITIAICTWNRSKSLHATLLSLQQLTIPPDIDLELLIVNNNCTDNTDLIVGLFADSLPIRLLREERQGLSNARNCAIEAARGDYILWTDDDVIVDPNWLVAYVNATRTWPNASLFGGPIKLQFAGNPPSWLLELLSDQSLAIVYARCEPSDTPVRLNFDGWMGPHGANFCTRLCDQRIFHYDPRLGRYGKEFIAGEEHAVMKAMLGSGLEGWWVPDAVVHHVIPEIKQTVAHFRRYFLGQGRTYARENPNDVKSNLIPFFGFLRLLLSAIKWELKFQVKRISKRPKVSFKYLQAASIQWGRLFEVLREGVQFAKGTRDRTRRL
jgi:glycosyltransferase involved in cell wall biosynthesis